MEGKRRVQSLLAGAACLALSILALLLWGKLKLVTGVPRRAYAEPKPKLVQKPAPGRSGSGPHMADEPAH